MLTIRQAEQRGHADHGWLKARFSFSFADFYDPEQMGFRALRVLNEDRIAPGGGFPMHGHRDMEIVTYILSGSLEHRDNTGNKERLTAGEVQRMSAGRGIRHSEYNASGEEPLHLLQIWLQPARTGLEPGYEQKAFSVAESPNRWHTIVAEDGRDGALTIQQNVTMLAARLEPGTTLEHTLSLGRHAWIQVARGGVDINGVNLSQGDGLAISDHPLLTLTANENAEVILFDLA
ncbi:MAG: pirin family protein [Magnetococcales bacterium]|nr:pirin family protein [Magnetococcales bacterium]